MFPTFNAFQKVLIGSIAFCLFAGVVVVSGWVGLQASKRQFEAEAQNIVAVLRSGMSVVDGVATSLEASAHSTTERGYRQLNLHLAKVLANYDFVTGLGRFEKISSEQITAFESRTSDYRQQGHSLWRFDEKNKSILQGLIGEQNALGSSAQFPLALVKARRGIDNEFTDLSGFDLGSLPGIRELIESPASVGQSVIVSLPESWNRPGHLLVFRVSVDDGDLNGGYLLELDIEEMASSGGVDLQEFGLSLSSFSLQGEFESSTKAEPLYVRGSQLSGGGLFASKYKDNAWISSFGVGDKTMLLEVSHATGLSSKFTIAILAVASLLSFMFLSMAHLSSRRRLSQKLRKIESEKLYREQHRAAVTLAAIDDAVVTTNACEEILYANSAAETLLGMSSAAMQGQTAEDVIVLQGDRGSDDVADGEGLTLVSANGSFIHVNKKESVLKDSGGEHLGHVVVLRDVSVERSLTLALKYKVNHDSLTGLANRLSFEQQIDDLFEGSEESDFGNGICFIDLDRFKEVNDTCGHAAGDALLIRIGEAFKENVRDVDLVARLGGDEFGIILRNCAKPDALMVAERIKGFFQSFYFEYDGHVFPVRCSIGLVHFDPADTNRDDVVKLADAACYDAKNSGRNSICERSLESYTPESNSESGVLWLPRIKDAIENDKFAMHVQSIISLADGTATTHELLLRMIDVDGSLIGPVTFIKTAVRYKLATDIDRWVVEKAIEKISGLPEKLSQDKFVINLSVQTIGSTGFLEFLSEQIALSGVSASRLCFDIKEGDILHNPVGAADFCSQLQSMGCEVVLDDFGAAMTSLSTLKTMPINGLKIDGSLLANLNSSDSSDSDTVADRALVKSIHSFAGSMGLTTTAEQVEDSGCLEVLKSMHIDYAQGKIIAEPQPFEDFVLNYGSDSQQIAA